MARFRFRLEVSSRLAEQALEKIQREYVQEVRLWRTLAETYALQQERFIAAQEGQRNIGRKRPEELGIWQIFTSDQQRRLQQCNEELRKQELILENTRLRLLEAYREAEKLKRLKEKQAKAFQLAELQKEQRILDETGQVLYSRKQL
ncbi:MAG: flagellar export protein FliJ [Desulfosporosinus sp.]|jgi:flagellar FliJ protein